MPNARFEELNARLHELRAAQAAGDTKTADKILGKIAEQTYQVTDEGCRVDWSSPLGALVARQCARLEATSGAYDRGLREDVLQELFGSLAAGCLLRSERESLAGYLASRITYTGTMPGSRRIGQVYGGSWERVEVYDTIGTVTQAERFIVPQVGNLVDDPEILDGTELIGSPLYPPGSALAVPGASDEEESAASQVAAAVCEMVTSHLHGHDVEAFSRYCMDRVRSTALSKKRRLSMGISQARACDYDVAEDMSQINGDDNFRKQIVDRIADLLPLEDEEFDRLKNWKKVLRPVIEYSFAAQAERG